jgi:hypothetical protein
MYVYADESGNSGRNIFDRNQPIYFQGGLFTSVDANMQLCDCYMSKKKELGIDRIHANKLDKFDLLDIASDTVDILKYYGILNFHITVIEKLFICSCKFVDCFFDSGENQGVRPHWYLHEVLRNSIVLVIDSIFNYELKKKFWDAFLKNRTTEVFEVVLEIRNRIIKLEIDQRLKEVIIDGLSWAIENSCKITLLSDEPKKAYKGHTPNMIGFSSLVHNIHRFAKRNGLIPEAFYHDSQTEFKRTMKEIYQMFNGIFVLPYSFGVQTHNFSYDIGQVEVIDSTSSYGLQAADVFLYLYQSTDPDLQIFWKNHLECLSTFFLITKRNSEFIVERGLQEIDRLCLSEEDLSRGRGFLNQVEERMKLF